MYCLLDTCALLNLQEEAFKINGRILLSSLTLVELENIKTSKNKNDDIKYTASQVIHLLEEKEDQYEIILYKTDWDEIIESNHYILNNDSRIIATAVHTLGPDDIFITDDLDCKKLAQALGLTVKKSSQIYKPEEYTGYKVRHISSDEALADFYNNIVPNNENTFGLLTNQYLFIEDDEYKIIDSYCWDGKQYERVKRQFTKSEMFGKLSGRDVYQDAALHSLKKNQFTLLRGPAGSAKTLFSLGVLFEKLEKGEISKIVIFANPVASYASTKLGFYPGTRNEKILGTTIGGILSTKLGSITYVEQMLDDGTLELIPFCDLRGVDIEDAGVLVTEGQNLDISLAKLGIQRINENCCLIIEGDTNSQLDLPIYEGKNNGMLRAIKVFKGDPNFGTVTLKNIYRSKIAATADLM